MVGKKKEKERGQTGSKYFTFHVAQLRKACSSFAGGRPGQGRRGHVTSCRCSPSTAIIYMAVPTRKLCSPFMRRELANNAENLEIAPSHPRLYVRSLGPCLGE
ncbi:hypothetical protein EVAR_17349_1 [Eumeta japonica]|uniref:Uncharacterized protein n=1 Tax=Eumeta variegata TaxID=151549 RepID=A0A4C1WFF2_EUMVA|nr:hypothetical protein EVAR_17349_1 [Eumeta japonica]